MANTFELISAVTVGSGGASSIDFTSIPSTYTDIVIKTSLRGSRAASFEAIKVEFNGSSASLSCKQIYGDGASAGSAGVSQILFDANGANQTASTFANSEIYIPNYAGSANKSVSIDSVSETNGTTAYAELVAGLWSNTAAINRVTLTATSGTLVQFSTAYLYGVKNA